MIDRISLSESACDESKASLALKSLDAGLETIWINRSFHSSPPTTSVNTCLIDVSDATGEPPE